MLTLCWSAKGGTGTTVTAVGLALVHRRPTVLVDLAGDVPLVLGLPAAGGPGIADWLAADVGPARLARLEHPLARDLALLPRGTSSPPATSERWRDLAGHLAADPRDVVVDAGAQPPPSALAAAAQRRLLVVRNCYLNLDAATAAPAPYRPTGVILIEEPGRRLGAADVECAVGAPVVAVVLLDPAIARAADAGLMLGRVPGGLRRPLAPLAARPSVAGIAA